MFLFSWGSLISKFLPLFGARIPAKILPPLSNSSSSMLLSVKIFISSRTKMSSPSGKRVLLAYRRFPNVIFASRKTQFPDCIKTTRCEIASVAIYYWSMALKIDVSELLWWLAIRFLIKLDWETASVGLCGACKTHGSDNPMGVRDGVGDRKFTSSLEILFSGMRGISPALRNTYRVFF